MTWRPERLVWPAPPTCAGALRRLPTLPLGNVRCQRDQVMLCLRRNTAPDTENSLNK